MRWIVPTADNGHARIGPTRHGEAVQIELFGPKGGFRGAADFDTVAYAPMLLKAVVAAYDEAEAKWEAQEPVDGFDAAFSAVAEVGTH